MLLICGGVVFVLWWGCIVLVVVLCRGLFLCFCLLLGDDYVCV